MITINDKICTDAEEDCILLALFHYQLLCMDDDKMEEMLKRVDRILGEIYD